MIAGLLLLAGLIFGLMPASVGDVGCGSAFAADSSAAKQADIVNGYSVALQNAGNPLLNVDKPQSVVDQCSSAIGTRRAIAWPLIGVGVLGLLFLGLTIKPSVEVTAPATGRTGDPQHSPDHQ